MKQKIFYSVLITFSLVLVLVAAFFGYRWYVHNNGDVQTTVSNQPENIRVDYNEPDLYEEFKNSFNQEETVGGYIFITSAKKDNLVNDLWDSFVLDVAKGVITTIPHTDPTYFLNKSEVDNKYIYAGRPWKTDSQTGIYNDSILVTDFKKTTSLPILENPKGDYYTRLRLPRFSPNGHDYVYSAQQWATEKEKPQVSDIQSWKISVGNETLTSTNFAMGYGAVWADGGNFIVYVKRDGIYTKPYTPGALHSSIPETKLVSEFKVISDKGSYTPRNQIAISPNGQYLVVQHLFVDPKMSNGSIEIYKLDFSKTEPSASLVKRIALEAQDGFFWPLFSPGGRYLSFQTSNFKFGDQEENYIKIYDLLQEKYVKDIDFSQYKFDSSFNTDWVATKPF